MAGGEGRAFATLHRLGLPSSNEHGLAVDHDVGLQEEVLIEPDEVSHLVSVGRKLRLRLS